MNGRCPNCGRILDSTAGICECSKNTRINEYNDIKAYADVGLILLNIEHQIKKLLKEYFGIVEGK